MEERARLLPFPQAPDGVELRHLRAFVAVAEELSFARAADRLYLSAPALSRQIRGLEQLIGSELFRRSTHRVELTPAGEALLDRARKVLNDVDDAVSAAMTVSGELISRVAKLWQPVTQQLVARDLDLHDARAAAEEMQAQLEPPPGASVRSVVAGGVPALVAAPPEPTATTVMYLHGGAFILGSAYAYRHHAGALAVAAHTGVLVPDYRLAPEHPFPAALEDAASAYLWLLDRGIAPEHLTLVGDSSGGGLALSLALTLKEREAPLPGAIALLCPWLDLRLEDETHSNWPAQHLDEARRCIAMYLSGHPIDTPVLDPLSADLGGLPPMLIQAATGDACLQDAKRLAGQALAHGVNARLELFPVDAHAFHLFWSFLPEATDAIESAGAFIREITGSSFIEPRLGRS